LSQSRDLGALCEPHGSSSRTRNLLSRVIESIPAIGVMSGLQAALQGARESQKQADELLHCLLPEAAAEEIRNIGTVIPRRYNNVAALFCDVVNFTSFGRSLNACCESD
jgi:hypothetical protein